MLSIFYCGFGGDYCGQSNTDDVNPAATIVILAFANTQADGSVKVDEANFPQAPFNSWKASGKKVLISVGGQNGNWNYVFASSSSIDKFVSSLSSVVQRLNLDGVDLDIESFDASPKTVANTIIKLKTALGSRLLVVSPQCGCVYQCVSVPNVDTGGNYYNYFVPIIRLADAYIDYYQPQAYNDWY